MVVFELLSSRYEFFCEWTARGCSLRTRLGPFYVLAIYAVFGCSVWDLYMCSYSRLQSQSTGDSLTPPTSQRLRRVHRATIDKLNSSNCTLAHFVLLHSWNSRHAIPLCIFQYTIPLVCDRDWVFMVLDRKIHMGESSKFKEWSSLLRVYGPSGPSSCMVLSPCVRWKGFGWDVVPPSFAGSSLKRSSWFYLAAWFLHAYLCCSSMNLYLLSSASSAYAVYSLSLSTHPSWICFRYNTLRRGK